MSSSEREPEAEIRPVDGPGNITEFTPLLANDEEQQQSAEGTARSYPSERFFIIFHWLTLAFGIIVLALVASVVAIAELASPEYYHFYGPLKWDAHFVVIMALASITWAISNLVRYRRNGTLLPLAVGAFGHGVLGVYTTGFGLGNVNVWNYSSCGGYYEKPDADQMRKCNDFRAKFHVLLWFYVAFVIILGITNLVLFVSCCIAAYRSRSVNNGRRSGSWHGFSFPAGQLTVEFTVKFLRPQDTAALPPANLSPLAEASAQV
ncbi:hypothetical protein B0H66DRAFT_605059 [Apodospora peruviana]|uniref:Uncharacterized protein n=1 Tax=Apodospora peruviana TaxID=516989 RepID=A0AAE0M2E4_9PEZI|nr:hypothetical protein B0H66DRAFT_605059 [Apodospora peruviana]